MTEIIIELGYNHAPSRLPVKKLKTSVTKKEKSKQYGRVSGKKSFLTVPPHSN